MHRIVGTDSNGGVLYVVHKPRRRRARYEGGQAAATESARSSEAAQQPTRRRKGSSARGDGPAGQESGERPSGDDDLVLLYDPESGVYG